MFRGEEVKDVKAAPQAKVWRFVPFSPSPCLLWFLTKWMFFRFGWLGYVSGWET